ncbi:MAG: hypothetical protein J6D52_04925, partial [Clostridia bacterium]|nr:hypothetical protein [Clostridia bacterium]
MYLVSGYTNGERNVHRSDHRPKSGRWLQRKLTPFQGECSYVVVKCDDRLIWGSVSRPHRYSDARAN